MKQDKGGRSTDLAAVGIARVDRGDRTGVCVQSSPESRDTSHKLAPRPQASRTRPRAHAYFMSLWRYSSPAP